MKWMGMLSALLVLVAVFIGISTLGAFGFDAWEIVKLLAPVAVGVAVFSALLIYLGLWSVRWLNRPKD